MGVAVCLVGRRERGRVPPSPRSGSQSPCFTCYIPAAHLFSRLFFHICRSAKHNGYIHSAGTAEARKAVAKWVGTATSPLTENVSKERGTRGRKVRGGKRRQWAPDC